MSPSPNESTPGFGQRSEAARQAQRKSVQARKANKLAREARLEKRAPAQELRLEPKAYTPSTKQKAFGDLISDGKKVVLFLGGIRSGKSYAGAYESVKQIYVHKRIPCLGWIVAPTYKMSKTAEELFAMAAGPCIFKYIKADREFLLYPHPDAAGLPFRVQVRSADNPDHLRGPSVGFIWADEASLMSQQCYQIMRGRTLDCNGVIFMTTTPRGKDWLYEDVYVRSQLDSVTYGVVRSKTDENPYLNYSEVMEFRKTYPDEFAKRELDAEFINFEGLVYKTFDPIKHCLDNVKVTDKTNHSLADDLIIGMDPGYADPFAVLWICKKDGKFIVVDEFYERWKTPDQIINYIKGHPYWRLEPRIWCDPSSQDVIATFNQAGMKCFGATRGELTEGINIIARYIELGQLYVARKCTQTIREFGAYSYPNRDGRNTDDKPRDFSNHAMDAIRYALTSEYGFKLIHDYSYNDGESEKVIKGSKEDFDKIFAGRWYETHQEEYDRAERGLPWIQPEED